MATKNKVRGIHDIRIPAPADPRIYKVQVKRDFYLFDQKVLGHDDPDENILRIYQLKAAAPMIYIERHKIQKSLESWMRAEECYSEEEIQKWSWPVYEWPDVRISKDELRILHHWRKKYKIKDRTDWTKGVTLSDEEKARLDKYKQISILQPRQSGKSEVVVRVNIYIITIVQKFRAAVFAPIEDQAREFIFQRTKDYIQTHPAFQGRFKLFNALDLEFKDPDDEAAPGSGSTFSASSASPTANIEGDTLDWAILDESQDISEFKVKKSIKYMLAATNGAMIKIGTVNTVKSHFWESTTKKGSPFWHQVVIHPDIVAATRPGWADFISREIEQEGRNSDVVKMSVFLEWMLEVGMFISEEMWETLLDPDMDWVEYDKTGLQFLLIDVAKSRDETVAKVIKVDQTRDVDGRHPFDVLNIMTLHGVDYTSQFNQIKSWIDNNYNIAAVGVDDTGGRGGIGDAFDHTPYRVEKFTYTRPGKSEWYTNLSTIINAHYTAAKEGRRHDLLIRIPGSQEARKEKIFRDFEEQMMDLQKEYKNTYMVVHHPARDGAKDDYPDTLMMAGWMASRVMISIDEMSDHIKQIEDTVMDRMDWDDDLFGPSQKTGPKRRKKAAVQNKDPNTQDKDDLLEQIQRANSLDQPKW